jgi:hypothetical protein
MLFIIKIKIKTLPSTLSKMENINPIKGLKSLRACGDIWCYTLTLEEYISEFFFFFKQIASTLSSILGSLKKLTNLHMLDLCGVDDVSH